MSTSIAIYFKKQDEEIISSILSNVRSKVDLNFVRGAENSYYEVQAGLKVMLDVGIQWPLDEKFDDLYLVTTPDTPDNPDENLAYDVYKDLVLGGAIFEEADFVQLLDFLENELKPYTTKLLFVFCDEFYADSEARFMRLSPREMRQFLSFTYSWTMQLWEPKRGVVQERETYPVAILVSY